MAYREGFETGFKTGGGNPFTALMKGVSESMAERQAEQKERRKKDLEQGSQLQKLFLELGKKFEYERELQRLEGEEKRKTKTAAGLLEQGLVPTESGRYTPEEFRRLPSETVETLMPRGGWTPGGGLPVSPNVLDVAGLGKFRRGFTPATGTKEANLKARLLTTAQNEAFKRMGGSFFGGMKLQRPEEKRKYEAMVNKLYKTYLKEVGITETELEDDLEENFDENIFDTGW